MEYGAYIKDRAMGKFKENLVFSSVLFVIILLDFAIWALSTDFAVKAFAKSNHCTKDCVIEAFSGMIIGFLIAGLVFGGMYALFMHYLNKRKVLKNPEATKNGKIL